MDYRDLNDESTIFDERLHSTAREQFPALAAAIARGDDLRPDSRLQAHLSACAACRADLHELVAVAKAAYNGQIPNPEFPGRVAQAGVALEADWDGNILWEVRNPDHHHDPPPESPLSI